MILRRVLVANRGEIAVRVLRTCQRLGIETVLAVPDADADSVPTRLAGQTIRIGPESAAQSYLNVEGVVAAAVAAGADAIHPGYGFLSENPRLARACEAAGIVFIGPSADVLEAAGDKLAARNHAVGAGLPVLPGGLVHADGASGAGAARLAERIGYPVLVKAAGCRGGRGLRVVREPGRQAEAVAVASAEARAALSDPRVYLEQYVSPARHVEVQVLGDGENVIHLGDRDCLVQRRYQKARRGGAGARRDAEGGHAGGGGRLRPAAEVPGPGHRRIPGGRRTVRVLVPRGERAHPGGAPGDRGGHRARPGRGADRDRGGARAPAGPGRCMPARRPRCPTPSASWPTCASSGTRWTWTTGCWPGRRGTSTGWPRPSHCRPASRDPTTRRSPGTSWPAAC